MSVKLKNNQFLLVIIVFISGFILGYIDTFQFLWPSIHKEGVDVQVSKESTERKDIIQIEKDCGIFDVKEKFKSSDDNSVSSESAQKKSNFASTYLKENFIDNVMKYLIPPDLIIDYLDKNLAITSDDIPKEVSASDYALNLFKIYKSPVNIECEKCLEMYFSENVYTENNYPSQFQDKFNKNEKIYAVFKSKEGVGSILTRWVNVETGNVTLMKRYDIDANKEYNYIWMRPSNTMNPGNYQVEIIDPKNFSRMNVGRFEIN